MYKGMCVRECACMCAQSVERDAGTNHNSLTPEIYEFKWESVRNLMTEFEVSLDESSWCSVT